MASSPPPWVVCRGPTRDGRDEPAEVTAAGLRLAGHPTRRLRLQAVKAPRPRHSGRPATMPCPTALKLRFGSRYGSSGQVATGPEVPTPAKGLPQLQPPAYGTTVSLPLPVRPALTRPRDSAAAGALSGGEVRQAFSAAAKGHCGTQHDCPEPTNHPLGALAHAAGITQVREEASRPGHCQRLAVRPHRRPAAAPDQSTATWLFTRLLSPVYT